MAWKDVTTMSQRLEFVVLASAEGVNVSELCRRFGVSRKTGYKWLSRYAAEGSAGLVDQSRRPLESAALSRADWRCWSAATTFLRPRPEAIHWTRPAATLA